MTGVSVEEALDQHYKSRLSVKLGVNAFSPSLPGQWPTLRLPLPALSQTASLCQQEGQ